MSIWCFSFFDHRDRDIGVDILIINHNTNRCDVAGPYGINIGRLLSGKQIFVYVQHWRFDRALLTKDILVLIACILGNCFCCYASHVVCIARIRLSKCYRIFLISSLISAIFSVQPRLSNTRLSPAQTLPYPLVSLCPPIKTQPGVPSQT